MIAPRHHTTSPSSTAIDLVELALTAGVGVGVDALEAQSPAAGSAGGSRSPRDRIPGQIVPVVLVRRIARRVAAGRDDLDHQQRIRRLALGQHIGDVARVGALAARLLAEILGRDQARRQAAAETRRRADGKLDIGIGGDRPAQISRARRPTTACRRTGSCARRSGRNPGRRPRPSPCR